MANENTFDMKIAPPYFQWVIDDKLAAFAFPSKAYHIAYLLENNIRTLISLQTYPDPPVSEFKDVEWHKISVREFHPPTVPQMCRFVEIVDTAIAKGQVRSYQFLDGLSVPELISINLSLEFLRA